MGGSIVQNLRLVVTGTSAGAVGALQTLGARMQALGARMRAAGGMMTTFLTLPILGVAAASVKMAVTFEEQLTHIRALVGASEAQMKTYKEGIMAVARETAIAPKEVAEAMYFVTSSGFEGAAALRVLQASGRASAAGLGDFATIADAVTSAVNAYGETTLSASRSTDILLATVREGKMEPEELAGAIGRVIAPAQLLGISFDQVGAAMASMSLVGLDANEAATALRGTMMAMMKPSKAAQDLLYEFGMTAADLREQVKDKGLLTVLLGLKDAFTKKLGVQGTIEAFATLFPNVRGLNGVLIEVGKNADKNVEIQAELAKSAGDTDRAFELVRNTAGFKLKKAMNDLKIVMTELGAALLPFVVKGAEYISKLTSALEDLSPGVKRFIVVLALVLAAVGPVLLVVGQLLMVLPLLLNPIGLIILAVIAAVAAFTYLYASNKRFRDIVNVVARTLFAFGKGFVQVVGWLIKNWRFFYTFFRAGVQLAMLPLRPFHNQLDWLGKKVLWLGDKVGGMFKGAASEIGTHWRGIFNTVVGWINKVIKAVNWVITKFGMDPISYLSGVSSGGSTARAQSQSRGLNRRLPSGDGIGSFLGGLTGSMANLFGLKLPKLTGPSGRLFGGLGGYIWKILKSWMGSMGGVSLGGKGYTWAYQLAKRFRLGISSTFRPGAITKFGNRSWHGYYGRAADFYGPDSSMDAFANYLFAHGRSFAEIIHEHQGMKYGVPFYYPLSDHYDHVHVARRGDGLGVTRRGGYAGPSVLAHPIIINVRLEGGVIGDAHDIGQALVPTLRRELELLGRRQGR